MVADGIHRRMTELEEKLTGWTGPSSATEQDKQDRTERMIRDAINSHDAFGDCSLTVYAKGSYANNTNVRADSDVDIAVQCSEAMYLEEEAPGTHSSGSPHSGMWTPLKLRSELQTALEAKFAGHVDATGSTAFRIASTTARVEADVVPCFDYRYYFASGRHRDGTKVFKASGGSIKNFPKQQLEKGRIKNTQTNMRFKKAVRIMKRVENAMVADGIHREVPSFFVECLVYNVPDSILTRSTWTETIRGVIATIWEALDGDEPVENSARWLEVNECKYLFQPAQSWTRADGRDYVKAAWNYLGYAK